MEKVNLTPELTGTNRDTEEETCIPATSLTNIWVPLISSWYGMNTLIDDNQKRCILYITLWTGHMKRQTAQRNLMWHAKQIKIMHVSVSERSRQVYSNSTQY